ncbi:hypothetical protein E1A91_D06G196300v1 [Gossypium mustelinum]|uniref:Uncharacterized protein n=4 Tax=Gossypium TaxID=3633 RepID=A0A0D2VCM5_GOSRA|nr:hypothetical protein ES319_D06G196600v1 [Gossypium barbadense]KJB67505.1 hypothetical protein B456_010G194000 [Gossypium raimondii]TYH67785.1 hypothetical protein ES332_D06G211900v1 [Gossypium tomentosum]TYI78235.1 hypothetical protein E1A91_D06G196300v1 [Gossypium mustelinum]
MTFLFHLHFMYENSIFITIPSFNSKKITTIITTTLKMSKVAAAVGLRNEIGTISTTTAAGQCERTER